MRREIETVIRHLAGSGGVEEPLAKIDITGQFRPGEETVSDIARNLNASFLIFLSGKEHPLFEQAAEYMESLQFHPSWGRTVKFFTDGRDRIYSELKDLSLEDQGFRERLMDLSSWLEGSASEASRMETIEKTRAVFFPEGVGLCDDRDERIRLLREKRTVKISRLNPDPVSRPARDILFTSNILLTTPPRTISIGDLSVDDSMKESLGEIVQESQMYWYDHPIQIGVAPEQNEVIYGLRRLEEAVRFEEQRGVIGEGDTLNCLLSVSVTHEGIQGIAKEYLEGEFRKGSGIDHLNIYLFTEADTARLVDEILVPAASRYLGVNGRSLLHEIIGVDGEYGRHYTFLKAVSAFWQVFIDPGIKGTFKIDLDQIFPEDELVKESGSSAFEHFMTPLWGADGTDSIGRDIELGMIAGALVNERDIGSSLFSPDVCFPSHEIRGDELIFFSSLPQALSTESEMMTRYTGPLLDGKKRCIHRIHVTGGTNGILLESLRKHRPFTPTFIGRAEDQAYILSVLFNDSGKALRYLHKDGLIMRHDKEAFASEAIKAAYPGKLIGDYIRTLLFTCYARALPWPVREIKECVDPFTGCFISYIPFTVVYLRMAFKVASFFTDESERKARQGYEFLKMGTERLHETINEVEVEPGPLVEKYSREREGWNLYYDVLDHIETGIRNSDDFALKLQERARSLLQDCKMEFERG